jgi:hypothetical protein
VVFKDQNIFYGSPDLRITSYDLVSGSNVPRTGWPQNTTELARGLAISGDKVYGGASDSDSPVEGSLFSIPITGFAPSPVYPAAGNSRVFNLAIGAGNIAYFGAEASPPTKELLSLSLDTATAQPTRAPGNVGTLRGAPVIAKNNGLYTLDEQGRVSAWIASTLAPQWNLDVSPVVTNSYVSPTLDCRRDSSGQAIAGPGTLYIAAATRLYAFIVDSPGLDPNAPWPKYQHDARNTGNPATPITNCP